jgi:hypothetical protein
MLYSSTEAPVNFRSVERRSRTDSLPALIFLLGGCLLNALAYGSILPIVLSLGFFGLGLALLNISPLRGHYEKVIFIRLCAVGWFMAGIAAIYDNYLSEILRNDAFRFYNISSGLQFNDLDINQIRTRTEGSGAVIIWRAFYNGFALLGIDREIYIGLFVNIVSLAMTGVISIKIAKSIYGYDVARLRRLITLFSFCGIFWLFAAIHLRDVFALLGSTVLIYVWTLYLERPNVKSLVVVIVVSIILTAWFSFLRKEFVFVPSAMLAAALTAQVFFYKSSRHRKLLVRLVAIVGFAFSVFILPTYLPSLFPVLVEQNASYLNYSKIGASSDSLGYSLIFSQPLPIKIVLGTVWVILFPLPVWSGFQLESAYHLFKSLNAIYMYFVIPLFGLAVLDVVRQGRDCKPAVVFNLFVIVGFLLATVGTSGETRHFATFLVAMFMVALQPDLTRATVRMSYKNFLSVYFMGVIFLHVMWAALKLL